MKYLKLTVFRLFLVSLINSGVLAQETKYSSSLGLLFDQDVLSEVIGLNEDRNYTQGLGIQWSSLMVRKFLDTKLRLKNPSNNVLKFPTIITIQLAGFTPDDLKDTLPIIGDRPYSSVIFLSFKDYRVDQERFRSRYWGFYLGVLGIPNIAKRAQTAIHQEVNQNNTIPPYNPAGWHNQISQGGEPTIMVSYGVKKLLTKHSIKLEANRGRERMSRGIRSQVTTNWQVDLGYLTQFTIGGDFRIGSINLKKWHNDSQWSLASTSTKKNNLQKSTPQTRKNDYYGSLKNNNELYLFCGIRAGLMLYNASLHGQFRNTAYRLDYWDTGFFRNTGRFGLGGTKTFCKRFNLNFTIYGAYKNSEIVNAYARTHFWGGFTLNLSWLKKKY